MTTVRALNSPTDAEKRKQARSIWTDSFIRFLKDRLSVIATIGLVIILFACYLGPVIVENVYDVDPNSTNLAASYTQPNSENLLGTDAYGRDQLIRLLYGGRVSLAIAVTTSMFSISFGLFMGLAAGYFGGWVDSFIMWFITTLNAIPSLMLLILLAAVLTPSVSTLIFSLTLISWTTTMRLVRGETLSHRSREYVLSAEAIGARPLRIMYVQILPNVFSVFIVALALQVGTLILVEAALSFLGLGVRPPTPSWGNMLTEAQRYFRQGPHLSILPGLMIVATVLSLYLIGDGLRDAFDPQASKKK